MKNGDRVRVNDNAPIYDFETGFIDDKSRGGVISPQLRGKTGVIHAMGVHAEDFRYAQVVFDDTSLPVRFDSINVEYLTLIDAKPEPAKPEIVFSHATGTLSTRYQAADLRSITNAIADEVRRAGVNHKPLNSAHEAYSVILEELDEFWDEVRKKTEDRSSYNMRTELIQTAAMCIRTILDLGL